MDLDRLDANKLLTFLAVAEAGGVTAASRRLALTRSAVSHSLRALEASLGLPLFHRVGKRMIPTREGRVLRGAVAAARATVRFKRRSKRCALGTGLVLTISLVSCAPGSDCGAFSFGARATSRAT